jgi:hypothetical protein
MDNKNVKIYEYAETEPVHSCAIITNPNHSTVV